jgi:hypothetical protein
VTIFQDDSSMVDADLREVVRPGAEGRTVRHGERKVVHMLICRLVRPPGRVRGLREHNHELGTTVSECDVAATAVLGKGYKSEHGGIPARARFDVCCQKLEVRETGDRRRGPRFFERRHASDVSDRSPNDRTELLSR